ncbi:hypothetical protein [Bifidobacterium adolescentis]|nr:hypothetical protein [Bifidobacterium adolescentis]
MRLAKVMLLSFDSLYFHRQFLCNVVNRFSSIAVFAGASMLAFLFDEVARKGMETKKARQNRAVITVGDIGIEPMTPSV